MINFKLAEYIKLISINTFNTNLHFQGKESGIAIARLSDSDLLRTLESAIRLGKSCLIENVGIEVDPALDPILLRQVFRQGGTYMLKIGDSVLPYNFDFKLYMTTKLPNPHYSPELAGKVMLVNFTLVPRYFLFCF